MVQVVGRGAVISLISGRWLGLAHREEYPDAGLIQGRIVGLGEPAHEGALTSTAGQQPSPP